MPPGSKIFDFESKLEFLVLTFISLNYSIKQLVKIKQRFFRLVYDVK